VVNVLDKASDYKRGLGRLRLTLQKYVSMINEPIACKVEVALELLGWAT